MAHKTLINGPAYEISGGRTLVNGTGYSIDKGKTHDGGTAYEIGFYTVITITGNGDYYNIIGNNLGTGCLVEIDGVQYKSGVKLYLPVGTVIRCIAYGVTNTFPGKISVNGLIVASTDRYVNKFSVSFDYVVTADAEINLAASYSSMADSAYGKITITET